MNGKENALAKAEIAWVQLRQSKAREKLDREHFAKACREANDAGVSDQKLATRATDGGLSRARIWQLRHGDSA